jgi:hypothetical protein
VQLAKAAPSSAHVNDEGVSVLVNEKLADVEVLGLVGLATIAVSGAVVSTIHVTFAGLASVLPARSLAFTWNTCEPSARPLYASGLLQVANAAPSNEHANVAGASVLAKEKVAPVEPLGLAGEAVIDVSGATESTVHVKLAGVASVLPAASLAFTWKVCEPWPSAA